MSLKRSILTFAAFFLFVSVSLAAMTIYFKDGSSRQVYKIVFKGQTADLYLLDGSINSVLVEKLDLPSSGIGSAVGTYGETGVTRNRPVPAIRPSVAGDPARQSLLKMEWERSQETATATANLGSIRKGDVVKIVNKSQVKGSKYEYVYDDEDYYDEYGNNYTYRTYTKKQVNLDEAFIVLYQRPDGSFGKKLLDAATFSSHFKLTNPLRPVVRAPKESPVEPRYQQPPKVNPRTDPPVLSQPAPIEKKQESGNEEASEASSRPVSNPVQYEEPDSPWIPITGGAVALALVAGGFFFFRNREKPFVNTSKFAGYEEDLREFEISIWLKNGKTLDQLMEICLKKFYQENPAALGIVIKMWKGGQKGWIIPLIMKQSGKDNLEAEVIYVEFEERIQRTKRLIQEVSTRTGVSPAPPLESTSSPRPDPLVTSPTSQIKVAPSPATDSASKSAAGAVLNPPVRAQQAVPAPVPAASGGTSSVAPALLLKQALPISAMDPDQPSRKAGGLPAYANTVLEQLGFLSGADEKLT